MATPEELNDAIINSFENQNEIMKKMAQQMGINVKDVNTKLDIFGRAVNDAGGAANSVKTAIEHYNKAIDNLNRGADSAVTGLGHLSDALLNTTHNFEKYGSSLKSFGEASLRAGLALGTLGTIVGGAVLKGVGMLGEAAFKQADNINKAYDDLAKVGGSGGIATKEILDMGHQAGLTSKDLSKLTQVMTQNSQAIASFTNNFGEGAKVFGKITAVGADTVATYTKLGVSQEELLKTQGDYVALQAASGRSLKGQITDTRALQQASLEYQDNLLALSKITGDDVDSIKRKQKEANLDIQWQIANHNMEKRIADLRARTGDENAKREADQLEKELKNRIDLNNELTAANSHMALGIREYISTGTASLETTKELLNKGLGPAMEETREALKLATTDAEKKAIAGKLIDKYNEATLGAIERMPIAISRSNDTQKRLVYDAENLSRVIRQSGGSYEKARAQADQEVQDAKNTSDPALKARAELTAMEIKAQVALDKLLAKVNPLVSGFTLASGSATALAAAAGLAAAALIGFAGIKGLKDLLGGVGKGLWQKGPKGGPIEPTPGTPPAPKGPAPGSFDTSNLPGMQKAAGATSPISGASKVAGVAEAAGKVGVAEVAGVAGAGAAEAGAVGAAGAAGAASKAGKFAKFANYAGKLKGGLGGLAGGLVLDYAGDKLKESGHEKLGAGTEVAGKALEFGSTGAMLGSFLGPAGTLVGGGVGAAIGAGVGLYKNWDTLFGGSDKDKDKAKPEDIKEQAERIKELGKLDLGDSKKIEQNANAFVMFGNAMAAYKGGLSVESSGDVSKAAGKFFDSKIAYKELQDFAKLDIGDGKTVKTNAEALATFGNALGAYVGGTTSEKAKEVGEGANSFFDTKVPFKQLQDFSNLVIGDRTQKNAEAFVQFSDAMAKSSLYGGAIDSYSKMIGGMVDGISKMFGNKDAVQKFVEFTKLDVDPEKAGKLAEAFSKYAGAMGTLQGVKPAGAATAAAASPPAQGSSAVASTSTAPTASQSSLRATGKTASGGKSYAYEPPSPGAQGKSDSGSRTSDVAQTTSPKDIKKVLETGPGFNKVETNDGEVQIRKGVRNWRNNNPGNIVNSDFARRYGAIGGDDRFAIFPTLEAGKKAKEDLLFGQNSKYIDLSIANAINRYAPPNENNTSAYINSVTKALGNVSPDTVLKSLDSSQRQSFLDAISKVEGFKEGQIYKARNGGMFEGPESGYLVELHGKEMVAPTEKLSQMLDNLKQVSKTELPTEAPKIQYNTQEKSDTVALDMMAKMIDSLETRIEELIGVTQAGNDTRQQILKYSKA